MFGRSKQPTSPADPSGAATSLGPSADPSRTADGGKGRPTPTRREAQEAARQRAKVAQGKTSGIAADRAARKEQRRKIREGMKAGNESFLLPRDRGGVRRFLRDRVDTRISAAEFILPLLLVVMFLTYSSNDSMISLGNTIWLATMAVTIVDTTWLLVSVRKELRQRFPATSHKGWWGYLLLRALQLRFLRLPKPQYSIGEKLPAHYRD
ncbi:DUF3043 domain-containing protein [Nocardioidaceae bacterium]|nr:DUF3043 domain-containing protein [Nocardioidaceae bacterium]